MKLRNPMRDYLRTLAREEFRKEFPLKEFNRVFQQISTSMRELENRQDEVEANDTRGVSRAEYQRMQEEINKSLAVLEEMIQDVRTH